MLLIPKMGARHGFHKGTRFSSPTQPPQIAKMRQKTLVVDVTFLDKFLTVP